MKSLKIAVVGLGLMGERHVRVFDKMPLVELYALCDKNEQRLNLLSETYGTKAFSNLEEMLKMPELDAVDIVLPDNLHLEAIKLAVKYNKHILVEKPMACVLNEAQEIYNLTKDYKKTFMIGHILRFDARYAHAKSAVETDELGEIVSVYCRRNSPIAGPLHYRGATDLSMHVMVHDIDAVQWICASRVKTVFAKAKKSILAQYNMTDAIFAVCTLENGAMICFEACWVLPDNMPGSIDDRMEIVGSSGALVIDPCDKGTIKYTKKGVFADDSRHWPELNGGISGALYEELTYFVNCIVKEKQSFITALDGLTSVKVVNAIEESIKSGKEVIID